MNKFNNSFDSEESARLFFNNARDLKFHGGASFGGLIAFAVSVGDSIAAKHDEDEEAYIYDCIIAKYIVAAGGDNNKKETSLDLEFLVLNKLPKLEHIFDSYAGNENISFAKFLIFAQENISRVVDQMREIMPFIRYNPTAYLHSSEAVNLAIKNMVKIYLSSVAEEIL